MKKLIHIVLVLFCSAASLHVFGQTREIDSLKALLNNTKGDERFDVLDEIIYLSQTTDVELAIKCADQALKLIPQLSDSSKIARAYRLKGHFLVRMERNDAALPFLDSALKIAEKVKDYSELRLLFNLYGIVFVFQGEYGKALDSFYNSKQLLGVHEKVRLGVLQTNIGLVFYKLGNNTNAIKYYKRALKNQEHEGDCETKLLLINIGLAYCAPNEYDQAFSYISRGLNNCKTKPKHLEIQSEYALGLIKFKSGFILASEPHFQTSLVLSRQTQNDRFIPENLVYLARIYLEKKQFDLSKKTLQEAEKNAIEHGFNELLVDTYRVFLSLYDRQGNVRQLSSYYLKYNALLEKLHGRELLQQISVFQVDMKHEANLQTMAHQKQVLDLQDNSLRQQRRIYVGISVLIALIVFILLLLWRRNVQGLKIKALLEQRVMHRTEYLSRKKQILEDSNDFLTRYTDERFKKIIRLIPRFEHGGVYRYENYKSQLEPTIVRMKVISESVQLLRGACRKDYPDTTKRNLLGSLT